MWEFLSPSRGRMTLEDVAEDLKASVIQYPSDSFRLIIGTDSQPKVQSGTVTFVTAIILYRVGKGARYYIHKEQRRNIYALRQRMFTEASYSLQIGSELVELLKSDKGGWKPEVHLDIGERGATKQLIRELVAWITASGYEARIKPDSYGASKVADRYTRA